MLILKPSIFIINLFYFKAKTNTNVHLVNVLMEHQLVMEFEIVRTGLMKLPRYVKQSGELILIFKINLYFNLRIWNLRCQKYTFQCKYGACVSKESKCDGIRQCIDGSDEERCESNSNSPSSKPITTARPVHITTMPTTHSNNTMYL